MLSIDLNKLVTYFIQKIVLICILTRNIFGTFKILEKTKVYNNFYASAI